MLTQNSQAKLSEEVLLSRDLNKMREQDRDGGKNKSNREKSRCKSLGKGKVVSLCGF